MKLLSLYPWNTLSFLHVLMDSSSFFTKSKYSKRMQNIFLKLFFPLVLRIFSISVSEPDCGLCDSVNHLKLFFNLQSHLLSAAQNGGPLSKYACMKCMFFNIHIIRMSWDVGTLQHVEMVALNSMNCLRCVEFRKVLLY